MAGPDVRNLAYLNSIPGFGHHLVQALKDLRKLAQNIGQQVNAYPNGQETPPPPQIHALSVVVSGGVAHVQITDHNDVYRGINYHVDLTPSDWSAPITIHMGPSRDIRIPVGFQPLHYRAFSDYPTSGPSTPVYFAGNPVTSIGANQPPIPAGQGSGTGFAGQISGHGPIPYRGSAPPRRS